MPGPMTPEQRAEGLAAASRVRRAELIRLGEEIAHEYAVELMEPPAAATLMVQLQAAVGEFCLTEVVVTPASVRAGERHGWACVPGWDDEAAVAAALCDAIADTRVDELVTASLELEAAARTEQQLAMSATRLDLA